MSTSNITKDVFKGKEFFLGIDVSKDNWVICIREGDMQLKYLKMPPEAKELYGFMSRNYPGGIYKAVHEAGFTGYNVQRKLEAAGFKSIMVHAADVPTTDSERDQKTDAIDARKLALELEKGRLNPLYILSEDAECLRMMARMERRTCTKELSRWKHRITSHLHLCGVRHPRTISKWSNDYMAWLASVELDNGPARRTLEFMLEEHEQFKKRRKQFKNELKQSCIEYFGRDLLRYVMSLPGIGTDTAIVLLTELVEIERFSNFDKLCRYAGLIPSRSQTGNHDPKQGLTDRRNKHLRYVLIESSWTAIRSDPELYAAYTYYTDKRKMERQDAIIRIAKKLLKRLYVIWNERRPYEKRYLSDN